MRAPKTPSVPALQRGLAILERIAKSRRGLTFAQLTRHFDFPKSSVHTLRAHASNAKATCSATTTPGAT